MAVPPSPSVRLGDETSPRLTAWMRGWLMLQAAVFLVPAALLASQQWQGRRADRLALAATLDPTRPEPGAQPIEDVPTDSAHTRRELLFVPDRGDTAISHRATLSNYRVVDHHAVEHPHTYRTSRGRPDLDGDPRRTYSQPRLAVLIDRGGLGLFAKMFQALFISVAVALLTSFIKPTHVDPRFGLGVGGLFAVVANAYFVGSLVPETNEFSLADVVNLLGIVTILLSLTQSTLSLHVYETQARPALSRKFDRVSFWTMLGGFGVSLAMIVGGTLAG